MRLKMLVLLIAVLLLCLCSCEGKTESPPTGSTATSLKSNDIELDSWVGTYHYSEVAEPYKVMDYNIYIEKEEELRAKIVIDGYMTMIRIQALLDGDKDCINLLLEEYLPDNDFEPYQEGDVLLSLKVVDGTLMTYWGKITSLLSINDEPGPYFIKTSDEIVSRNG